VATVIAADKDLVEAIIEQSDDVMERYYELRCDDCDERMPDEPMCNEGYD